MLDSQPSSLSSATKTLEISTFQGLLFCEGLGYRKFHQNRWNYLVPTIFCVVMAEKNYPHHK
jgi:hypothetical protein